MLNLFLRRLASMVLIMAVVSFVLFLVFETDKLGVAGKVLGPYSSQQQREIWLEQNGYNRPFLVRYGEWVGKAVTGDFGDSIRFKTPVGEGAGMVELLPDGTLTGGDTTFSYSGTWAAQAGSGVKAVYSAKRIADGPPGVFGLDELDIISTGQINADGSLTCTGFAKQAPGLKLEIELVPSKDPPA